MTDKNKKRLAVGTLAAFLMLCLPFLAQDTGKPVKMRGFVYWASQNVIERDNNIKETQVTLTPVKDAIVYLRNTADKREFKSEPTPDDGSYVFKSLPPGTYEPGVEKNGKMYNVETIIRLDPGEDAIISFYLEKDRPAILPIRRGFFQTPWGIATVAAGSATAGIIIYNKTKKEEECSPTRR